MVATLAPCDITSQAMIDELARTVRDSDIPLGAIVHAAGISPMMADWRSIIDVDLIGSERLLQTILPLLESGACVVNIASIAGERDPQSSEIAALLNNPLTEGMLEKLEGASPTEIDPLTAYSFAKWGVIRMSERLACDWGKQGIRVVSIAPGLIDTPMGRLELEDNPLTASLAANTPINRPGQSEMPGSTDDIASVVAFLCSAKASFISGCNLRVDGGLVAAMTYGQMAMPDQ